MSVDNPPDNTIATELVVVGAAAGMGRWLCEHLFSAQQWTGVLLVDQEASIEALTKLQWRFAGEPDLGAVVDKGAGTSLVRPGTEIPASLPTGPALICLSLPADQIAKTARWLVPSLNSESVIFETTSSKVAPQAALKKYSGGRATFGIHPLFDSSARTLDGQTVFVTPSSEVRHQHAHLGLSQLISNQGGTTRIGTPVEHDHLMNFVQALPHKSLMVLVDTLIASQMELEDLWEVRTPLFEAVLGLAVRVLAVRNERSIASIQVDAAESDIDEMLFESERILASIVSQESIDGVAAHIAELRAAFSGALFDAIRLTSNASVAAAQAKRAELSRRRRTGELTGLKTTGHRSRVRVGRVIAVTPLDVTFEEWLLGPAGRAALVEGPSKSNARRLGVSGQPKSLVMRLAHVDLVVGEELEASLDGSLGTIEVDVRFLVPESVAGVGVLSVVRPHRAIKDAQLVSEVVRTGQREVVVRLSVRADYVVKLVLEELQGSVQNAYQWPGGVALPIDDQDPIRIYYLGPPGTFSETAAEQCSRAIGRADAKAIAKDSFEEVVTSGLGDGIAVLPISSSSSGLVTRSVNALRSMKYGALTVGGVVDVAVRFDAFLLTGSDPSNLKGSPVFSHPQALSQCGQFIERLELVPVPCPSTKASIDHLLAQGSGVAITSSAQQDDPRLQLIEREIDDLSGSITRFLLLGRRGIFQDPWDEEDPTLRSLWIGRTQQGVLAEVLRGSGPAFDEILTDDAGNFLWVTSRQPSRRAVEGATLLGRAPWTPRTPLVRVAVSSESKQDR